MSTTTETLGIQFWMVQKGLAMKIDRNMEWTGRITSLQVAKREGWTFGRTARQALRDLNGIAVAFGCEPIWSEKFGDETHLPLTVSFATVEDND